MAKTTLAARAAAAELAWRKSDKTANKALRSYEVASLRSLRRFERLVDRSVRVDCNGAAVYPVDWRPAEDDYSEESRP